jgi:hypothetical protein
MNLAVIASGERQSTLPPVVSLPLSAGEVDIITDGRIGKEARNVRSGSLAEGLTFASQGLYRLRKQTFAARFDCQTAQCHFPARRAKLASRMRSGAGQET